MQDMKTEIYLSSTPEVEFYAFVNEGLVCATKSGTDSGNEEEDDM